MPVTFALESHQTFATIYDRSGRIVGTIHRPYVTRAAQKAVPHGDKWTVTNRNGDLVLASPYRPLRIRIAAALGLS